MSKAGGRPGIRPVCEQVWGEKHMHPSDKVEALRSIQDLLESNEVGMLFQHAHDGHLLPQWKPVKVHVTFMVKGIPHITLHVTALQLMLSTTHA